MLGAFTPANEVKELGRTLLNGDVIFPLGFTRRGPIWPIAGAAPEDESDDDNADGDENDDDSSGDDADDNEQDDDDGGAGSEKDGDKGSRGDRVAELSRENARRRNENKTLKAQLEERENKLREFEDKDKTDLQKATDRAAELEKFNTSLTETVKTLRLHNAFLSANTYTWHDPEDALRLADLSKVEIDDEGVVDSKSMKAALKSLADAKPHLVKTASTGDATGDRANGRSNNGQKTKEARKAELARRGLVKR